MMCLPGHNWHKCGHGIIGTSVAMATAKLLCEYSSSRNFPSLELIPILAISRPA